MRCEIWYNLLNELDLGLYYFFYIGLKLKFWTYLFDQWHNYIFYSKIIYKFLLST